MRVIADICVIPIHGKISLRKEVSKAHDILQNAGLICNLHGYGTNVEGDIDQVLSAIKEIHETLHLDGVERISTSIKLGSRIDKETSIEAKILSVQEERTEGS